MLYRNTTNTVQCTTNTRHLSTIKYYFESQSFDNQYVSDVLVSTNQYQKQYEPRPPLLLERIGQSNAK